MKDNNIFIIFGDSISYGLYDNELYGWVNRIRNKSDFMKNSFYFNMSIPGQNSDKIVDRFDIETKSRIKETERFKETDRFNIIFSFGIKDAIILNDNPNHKDRFKKNINSLIKLSRKYTNNIYFIGLSTVDLNIRKNYNQENIDKLDTIIKETCTENDIYYISIKDIIKTNDLVDGIHPSEIGHQKLTDYLYENLFKIIEDEETLKK